MSKPEKFLKEEISFLLKQFAGGSIDIHQLMALIDMAYRDFLEFFPEEKPQYYDPEQLERDIMAARQFPAPHR